MTITDAQRWAIAQFCGWEFRPCMGTEDDCDQKDCGRWLLVGPGGCIAEWAEDAMDDVSDVIPRYETDPEAVGPMLLAMEKAGNTPMLARSILTSKWVCTSDQHIRTGDTMNEACCRAILRIIESGAKPQGGER